MRFHAFHYSWLFLRNEEYVFLIGLAGGRVDYAPEAKYLYSVRLFLGVCKIEVLWKTGKPSND